MVGMILVSTGSYDVQLLGLKVMHGEVWVHLHYIAANTDEWKEERRYEMSNHVSYYSTGNM